MLLFTIFVKKEILKKHSAIISFTGMIILLGMIVTQCAKQSSPTGGPQDNDPPVFLEAEPANRSVFFVADKAIITFNEFIQLKDPSKEIFMSPPMRTKPDFKTQGKKVIIQFNEELKPNTTYTVNFGNAITDYTEGNPLVNFEYVFATGAHLDSLSIPGKVVNALSLQPEKDILVMVYQDGNDTIPLDSLPLLVPPGNASRTTKDGVFRINNLAEGKYLLFALEDLNSNYIYDLPNERIAFLDSLVTLLPPPEIETPVVDSSLSEISSDSVFSMATNTVPLMQIDSAGASHISVNTGDFYTLYLFREADTIQKLLSKKLTGSNLLQCIFKLPADSVRLLPVNFEPETENWYLTEFMSLKDTVNFWLKPGLPDTLKMCVFLNDSVNDTSRYILSQPVTEKAGKRKAAAQSGFTLTYNLSAGALDYGNNLQIRFHSPVVDFDSSRLTFMTLTDTLVPSFAFTDTLFRQGEIAYPWVSGESYGLIIDDSAFTDLGGKYNDSTAIRFRIREPEEYGLFMLNLMLTDTNTREIIIQLMTDKEIPVMIRTVSKPGIVKFEYLKPGNYKIKAIHDQNMNGKWDPGIYDQKVLPEKVEYFALPVTIRANWDQQEDWTLD
jgi:uncharacterized protein (DUF2141 family)